MPLTSLLVRLIEIHGSVAYTLRLSDKTPINKRVGITRIRASESETIGWNGAEVAIILLIKSTSLDDGYRRKFREASGDCEACGSTTDD